jgi:hypothetical protein
MTASDGELHLERLLGRRVRDSGGKVVGRIEEFRADVIDDELVVTEVHLGPAALLERIGGFVVVLPFLTALARTRKVHRLPWNVFDFSNPDAPRITTQIVDG